MIKHFDVVVVGSGPGGFTSALILARQGFKTALVEREKLGGTCLQRGCIPKEGLYQIARSAYFLKKRLGVSVPLDFEKALLKVRERIDKIEENAKFLLKKEGVVFMEGSAKLVDEKVLKVERNTYLKADYIILACGSRQKEAGVSAEDLLTGKVKPKGKILIEGSGATACELSFILSVFGFEVLLKVDGRLLKDYPVEEELVEKLERELEMCGVKFTTTNEDADLLVKATGRVPNLCEEDFPFLERDEEGYVKVSPYMRTNLQDVYAVGDITKPMGAAHAIAKAKSACQCIMGCQQPYRPELVPVVICSALELGFVGSIKEGRRIVKTLNANTKSFVNGWNGMVSIIVDEEERLSYFSMLGECVSEPMNIASAIIGSALWDQFFFSNNYTHPSICESFSDLSLEFMFNLLNL
jgi:pyruvate/2-oxoglutarate dehydrogenase complex dihydrolipoamide dehydrogenase (E3) component